MKCDFFQDFLSLAVTIHADGDKSPNHGGPALPDEFSRSARFFIDISVRDASFTEVLKKELTSTNELTCSSACIRLALWSRACLLV